MLMVSRRKIVILIYVLLPMNLSEKQTYYLKFKMRFIKYSINLLMFWFTNLKNLNIVQLRFQLLRKQLLKKAKYCMGKQEECNEWLGYAGNDD